MSIFEIISAIILILACVFIVVVILLKDTKTQMSQSISGTSADSFYQKNVGRTKEAILNKATIVATVLFFVLAVAVNLINVYGKNANADNTSGNNAVVTSSDTTTTSSEASTDTSSSETSSDAASSDTSSDAASSGTSETASSPASSAASE